MGKQITYPDSGGSYTRKDGKLDLVEATEQLPAVPELKEEKAAPPASPPAATAAPPKPAKES